MMRMVPVSERIVTLKHDNSASLECYTNTNSNLLPPIRACFIGRVCGMVQRKADVIAAEEIGKWKKRQLSQLRP